MTQASDVILPGQALGGICSFKQVVGSSYADFALTAPAPGWEVRVTAGGNDSGWRTDGASIRFFQLSLLRETRVDFWLRAPADAIAITVTVMDTRFNQRGWTLSISANDFVGAETDRTIPTDNFSLEAGTVEVHAGDADPLPVAHSFSLSPESHVLFAAEPGSGSGRYSVPFTSEVLIPANTLADMYRTTITISLDSAP